MLFFPAKSGFLESSPAFADVDFNFLLPSDVPYIFAGIPPATHFTVKQIAPDTYDLYRTATPTDTHVGQSNLKNLPLLWESEDVPLKTFEILFENDTNPEAFVDFGDKTLTLATSSRIILKGKITSNAEQTIAVLNQPSISASDRRSFMINDSNTVIQNTSATTSSSTILVGPTSMVFLRSGTIESTNGSALKTTPLSYAFIYINGTTIRSSSTSNTTATIMTKLTQREPGKQQLMVIDGTISANSGPAIIWNTPAGLAQIFGGTISSNCSASSLADSIATVMLGFNTDCYIGLSDVTLNITNSSGGFYGFALAVLDSAKAVINNGNFKGTSNSTTAGGAFLNYTNSDTQINYGNFSGGTGTTVKMGSSWTYPAVTGVVRHISCGGKLTIENGIFEGTKSQPALSTFYNPTTSNTSTGDVIIKNGIFKNENQDKDDSIDSDYHFPGAILARSTSAKLYKVIIGDGIGDEPTITGKRVCVTLEDSSVLFVGGAISSTGTTTDPLSTIWSTITVSGKSEFVATGGVIENNSASSVFGLGVNQVNENPLNIHLRGDTKVTNKLVDMPVFMNIDGGSYFEISISENAVVTGNNSNSSPNQYAYYKKFASGGLFSIMSSLVFNMDGGTIQNSSGDENATIFDVPYLSSTANSHVINITGGILQFSDSSGNYNSAAKGNIIRQRWPGNIKISDSAILKAGEGSAIYKEFPYDGAIEITGGSFYNTFTSTSKGAVVRLVTSEASSNRVKPQQIRFTNATLETSGDYVKIIKIDPGTKAYPVTTLIEDSNINVDGGYGIYYDSALGKTNASLTVKNSTISLVNNSNGCGIYYNNSLSPISIIGNTITTEDGSGSTTAININSASSASLLFNTLYSYSGTATGISTSSSVTSGEIVGCISVGNGSNNIKTSLTKLFKNISDDTLKEYIFKKNSNSFIIKDVFGRLMLDDDSIAIDAITDSDLAGIGLLVSNLGEILSSSLITRNIYGSFADIGAYEITSGRLFSVAEYINGEPTLKIFEIGVFQRLPESAFNSSVINNAWYIIGNDNPWNFATDVVTSNMSLLAETGTGINTSLSYTINVKDYATGNTLRAIPANYGALVLASAETAGIDTQTINLYWDSNLTKKIGASGKFRYLASGTSYEITAYTPDTIVASTTTLSVTGEPFAYNDNKTISLIATFTSGIAGTATFYIGSTNLGSSTISSGVATFSLYNKEYNAGNYVFKVESDTDTTNSAVCNITISKAYKDVVAPTGLSSKYGQTLSLIELPANAEGAWSWKYPTFLVGNIGTPQQHVCLFTPNNLVNYDSKEFIIIITVDKATPPYTAPENLTAEYAMPLSSILLPIGWSWSNPASLAGDLGANLHAALFTPADTSLYDTVSLNLTVNVAQSSNYALISPVGLRAEYRTSLSSILLLSNPQGNIFGSWSWMVSNVYVGNVGSVTHLAQFSPDDSTHYKVRTGIPLIVTVTPSSSIGDTQDITLSATYSPTAILESISLTGYEGWEWAYPSDLVGNAGTHKHSAYYDKDLSATNYMRTLNVLTITVTKANALSAPTQLTATLVSTLQIALDPISGAEYSINNTSWQDSNIFTSLSPSTTYTFYARYKESTNYLASSSINTQIATLNSNSQDLSLGFSGGPFSYADGKTISLIASINNTSGATVEFFYIHNSTETSLGTISVINNTAVKSITNNSYNAGEHRFKVIFSDKSTICDISIGKASFPYTLPTNLDSPFSRMLSSVNLSSFNDDGVWTWDTVDGTSPSNIPVGNVGTRLHRATFTPNDITNYNIVNVSLAITVTQIDYSGYAVPTNLTATYGDMLNSVNLPSANWKWNSIATETPVGSTGTRQHSATFTPPSSNYKTVNVMLSIAVGKANYSLTIAQTPTDISSIYGSYLSSVSLSKYNINGQWSWNDNPSEILVGNAGTRQHNATFTPQDTNYNDVSRSITISVLQGDDPSLVTPSTLIATYGQTLINITLPSSWAWTDASALVGDVGLNQHYATFTPTDTNYKTVSSLLTITVGKASYTLLTEQIPSSLSANYNDKLLTISLYAFNISGVWAWNTPTNSVGAVGQQNHLAIFTPSNFNYATVSRQISITVNKLNLTLSSQQIPSELSSVYGDYLSSVDLSSFNIGGVWAWDDKDEASPESILVGNVGINSFYATFTPTDTNYNLVNVLLPISVTPDSDYSFTTPSNLSATYGQTLNNVALPAGWTWDATLTTSVGNAGVQQHSATYTPQDTNYMSFTVLLPITVAKASHSLTWQQTPTGLVSTFGNILASIPLTAFDVGGIWRWNTPSILVGASGNQSHNATFTPSDLNYSNVESLLVVNVGKTNFNLTMAQTPTTLSASYGSFISTVLLTEFNINGIWAWDQVGETFPNAIPVGAVGINLHSATFTPTDTSYNTVTTILRISVVKAQDPNYQVPTNLTGIYRAMLSSVDLPASWSWNGVPNETLVGNLGSRQHSATYTPTNDNYLTVTTFLTIIVSQADYTLSASQIPSSLSAIYGSYLTSVSLSQFNINGVWTWDSKDNKIPSEIHVGNAGISHFYATFTPTDSGYNSLSSNLALTVVQGTDPDYEEPSLEATFGQMLSDVTLTSNWEWTGNANAISVGSAGINQHSATFTPTDPNYASVTTMLEITVNKGDYSLQTEQLPTGLSSLYASKLSSISLFPFNIDGTWSWDNKDSLVGQAGIQNHYATFTPTNSNYSSVNELLSVLVTKAEYVLAENQRPSSLSAPYDSFLSSVSLLNFNISGNWNWNNSGSSTPNQIRVGSIGLNAHNATFTPSDTSYNSVSISLFVNVTQIDDPNYTLPTNLTATYGQMLSSVSLPDYWQWNDSANTIPVGGIGARQHIAVFTASSANYRSVTTLLTIAVTTGTYTLASSQIPSGLLSVYGNLLSSVNLTTFNVDGIWAWAVEDNKTPDEIFVGLVGDNSHRAIFTPTDTGYSPLNQALVISVVQSTPSVTIPASLTATYGQMLSSVSLQAPWSWDGTPQTIPVGNVGTQTHSATFTPSDTNFKSVTSLLTISVSKANLTLDSSQTPSNITSVYGSMLASIDLSLFNIDGIWMWNNPLSLVGMVGNQSHTVTFTPTNLNYNTLQSVISVTVTPANYTLSSQQTPVSLSAVYGTYLSYVSLSSFDLDGIWSWNSLADTLPDAIFVGTVGLKSHSATFTPNNTNYYPKATTLVINVIQAPPSFTVPQALSAIYGQMLSTVLLPDEWAWIGDPLNTPVGSLGAQLHNATFTPSDENYLSVTTFLTITVTPATYTLNAMQLPSNISAVYGNHLSDVNLVSFSIDGIWAWDLNNGKGALEIPVGDVGKNMHSATFTPSNTGYNKVSLNIEIEVLQSDDPKYQLPLNLEATYGETLSSVNLPLLWAWDHQTTSVGNAGINQHSATYTPSNINYKSVTAILEITVNRASYTLELSQIPVSIIANYGDFLADIDLSSFNINGNWSWNTPSKRVGDSGTQLHFATFTSTDTNYLPAELELSISVTSIGLIPSTPDNVFATYGDLLDSIPLPEHWTWDGNTSEILVGTVGLQKHNATYNGPNYVSTSQLINVYVQRAIPEFPEFDQLTASVGDALVSVSLPAGFTWKTPNTILNLATAQSFSAIFTPEDTDNYSIATTEIIVNVSRGIPSYTLPTDLEIRYADNLILNQISLPENWSWETPLALLGNAGVRNFMAIFTPTDQANYEIVYESLSIEIKKSNFPYIQIPSSKGASFGQKLATVELSSQSAGGVWNWENPNALVGEIGVNSHSVVFTPSDQSKYELYYADILVTVSKSQNNVDPQSIAISFVVRSESEIVLTPISGVEYSADNGLSWQSSNVFTNLSAGEKYTFVARFGETAEYVASGISAPVTIDTIKLKTSLSGGAVAGIIIGCVGFVTLAAVGYFIITKKLKKKS
jgi:hypothetical protein